MREADQGAMSTSVNGQNVQSVERAIRLLERLAEHNQMSLGQLAKTVGVHKSTAYRLLRTLIKLRYVEQDHDQGDYRVGIRLVQMGGMVNRSWPLHRSAESVMDQLAERLGESVNLAVEDDLHMVYVATVDARNLLRMQLNVGRRVPVHCTAVGKAFLAFSPDLVRRMQNSGYSLERLTPSTITTWDALEAELEAVRRHGFSIDDEEQEVGARCVAAPIADPHHRIVAALGISAPAARLPRERAEEVGPIILQAARRVSERLGT